MAQTPTSYIGVVATVVTAVAALQVILYLLNGAIIQATSIRKRLEILIEKDGEGTKLTVDPSDAQSLHALVQALKESQEPPDAGIR